MLQSLLWHCWLGSMKGIRPIKNMGGWWRWALVSPDGVATSRMVSVSASVNLPLHHKVLKFSSGTGSPGWSRKKGRKTVVWVCVCHYTIVYSTHQQPSVTVSSSNYFEILTLAQTQLIRIHCLQQQHASVIICTRNTWHIIRLHCGTTYIDAAYWRWPSLSCITLCHETHTTRQSVAVTLAAAAGGSSSSSTHRMLLSMSTMSSTLLSESDGHVLSFTKLLL